MFEYVALGCSFALLLALFAFLVVKVAREKVWVLKNQLAQAQGFIEEQFLVMKFGPSSVYYTPWLPNSKKKEVIWFDHRDGSLTVVGSDDARRRIANDHAAWAEEMDLLGI